MRRLLPFVAPLLVLLAACREELVCPQGKTDCEGTCVSLLNDDANCGACGAAIARPLEMCVAGGAACAPGVALCGDVCTDLARDADHCGGCETACPAGEYCSTEGGGSCTTTGACADGWTACGRACVQLDSDRFHCGACGNACAAGETCRDGACRADVFAACVNTNEVVPLTLDLAAAGDALEVPAGPAALAIMGGMLYSANGWPQASVTLLPLDTVSAGRDVQLFGSDLTNVVPYGNVLLVSNNASSSLVVITPSGDVAGEIPMPDQASGPNPNGVAVVGTDAYVALYGTHQIAKLDLSPLAACVAPDPDAPACGEGGACPPGRGCVEGICRTRCGSVVRTIDLLAIAGTSDPPGVPAPASAVAAAGRVFVGLSNLADDPADPWPYWVIPSGPGKLAVIDPGAGDGVSLLSLGGSCTKPGPLALHGSTLWVGCGSLSYPDLAPGTLVPVDLSKVPPAVGPAIDVAPLVPGALAFCAGFGYVADQASGDVLRFDPEIGTTSIQAAVCPKSSWGFAAVTDLACAD